MSTTYVTKLEREMIGTAILFFILVQIVKLLDSMNLFNNAPVSLFIASMLTLAYGLMVYRNGIKYNSFDA